MSIINMNLINMNIYKYAAKFELWARPCDKVCSAAVSRGET